MYLFQSLKYLLLGVQLVLGIGLSSTSIASAEQIRAATEVGAGGDLAIILTEFKAEVEKRSSEVKVNVVTGGALGTQRQLQEQLQLGTIEVIATASDIVELAGQFSVFDLPFLFGSEEQAHRALDGDLGTMLTEKLIAERGIRVLAFGELGFRQITNNTRPIVLPGDLKGLKIRTPSNEQRIEAFRLLGAAPTPIPYSELYSALQQGVVDGQENPVGTLEEQSLYEVQGYLSMTNHVYTPAYVLVNEGWWQGLSEEKRKLFSKAAESAADAQRKIIAAEASEIIAAAEDKGMQVNDANTAAFAEATKPSWQSFRDKYGDTLIKAAQSVR